MPTPTYSPHPPRHAVVIRPHSFVVRHRNAMHGPFEVQWALDLSAHELVYQGELLASLGTHPSVYADCSGTDLPNRVKEIAILVFAATCEAVRQGQSVPNRLKTVENTLAEHGLERFTVIERAAA